MSTTITETCGCGASLTVIDEYASCARRAATEWREQHKHAESVGICGNQPEWNGPATFPRPYCVLKAGHAGMHGDGDGGHWQATTTARTAEYGARIDPDGLAGRNREIPCADENEAQSGAERTRGSE